MALQSCNYTKNHQFMGMEWNVFHRRCLAQCLSGSLYSINRIHCYEVNRYRHTCVRALCVHACVCVPMYIGGGLHLIVGLVSFFFPFISCSCPCSVQACVDVCSHVYVCMYMYVCVCARSMCMDICACIEVEVQSWYYVSSSETGSPDDLGVHQFWLF